MVGFFEKKGKRGRKGPRDINDLYDEIEGELDHPSRTTNFIDAFKEMYKTLQFEYYEGKSKVEYYFEVPTANLKSLVCSWKPDSVKPNLKAIKKTAPPKGKANKLIVPKNASKSANPAPKKPPRGLAKR